MKSSIRRKDLRAELIEKVRNLEEDDAIKLVRHRIEEGDDLISIVEDCQEGLRQVGECYERREYYLSGLIMAGEIFRQTMELMTPLIELKFSSNESGIILLGTVQGDIHDIGKNSLNLLLTSYGFTVHDLGVDVPPNEFLKKAENIHPDIIGLSGLLTTSFYSMHETVQVLRGSSDQGVCRTPIIIGGNQLNEQVCQYVGADAWVTDAMTGVRICQKLMNRK